ncbi:MAG TPA: DUF1329 domain-containing protein [Aeromonadales bacterium]|nr:DUF1329 domain-containing protein [Aeromonadales bacterium]
MLVTKKSCNETQTNKGSLFYRAPFSFSGRFVLSLSFAFYMVNNVDSAEVSNKLLHNWKKFSQSTQNINHRRWLKALENPEAIKLATAWRNLRGYDAYDIIARYKLPGQLKPGLHISSSNINSMPWLKEYLPKEIYDSILSGKGFVKQASIIPTNTYYQNKGVLAATRNLINNKKVPYTDSEDTLRNPDGTAMLLNSETAAAIPYIKPENGLELMWSFVAYGVGTETLALDPVITLSCSQEGNIDYKYKSAIWWQKYHGRTQIGDERDVDDKEELVEGGAVYAYQPYDVRGFAGIRQRYANGKKHDDFKVFLPAMRRTRTLSGADAQDPMWAGLEVTWDDWRSYWVKTNRSQFEYKLVGEKLILASPEVGYIYNSGKFNNDKCKWDELELELRPVWILEIIDKSGSYQYKKRTLYIDMETYYSQYERTTDQRDNIFRIWDDSRAWRPFDGDSQWRHITIYNAINHRVNYFFMTPQWDNRSENVTDEQFDIDQLRDYQ